MATKEERDQFARTSAETFSPVLEFPPIPDHFKLRKSDREAWAAWEKAVDEWRRKLQLGPIQTAQASAAIQSTLSASAKTGGGLVGPMGPAGPAGAAGADGQDGEMFPALDTGMVGEVWIAKRTDGLPGSGTQGDPFDGSTTLRFDSVMDSIPANTHIHIAPGVYTTRGNLYQGYDLTGQGGFMVKAGQKIQGSGINITTLKLVESPAFNAVAYYQIFCNTRLGGVKTSDGIEICHMTLDFNYDHDGNGEISGGFVNLDGNRNWIHHLRLIHWGARANHESFPITNAGDHSITEFILMDTPDEGNRANNVSCIFTGLAGQEPNGGIGTYAKHVTIRHCLLDGAKADGTPSINVGISCDGIGAIVVENNIIANIWTGGPYRDSWHHPDTIVIRNNYYYNVIISLYYNLGGQNTHPATYDFHTRPIFQVASITSVGTTATITTVGNHNLVPGDWFELTSTDPLVAQDFYDGLWQVVSMPTLDSITFTIPDGPLAPAVQGWVEKTPVATINSATWSFDGTNYYLTIDAGTNHGVLVGGTILTGSLAGPALADGHKFNLRYATVLSITSTTFTVLMGYLTIGAPTGQPTGGGVSGRWFNRTGQDVKSVSVVGSTVTVETTDPHDLLVGDQLVMQGVRGAAGASFNGYPVVSNVPDNTHFKYVATSPPSGSTTDLRWCRKWGVHRVIFENNVIVLADTTVAVGTGLALGAYPYSGIPNFRVYDQVIIRGNHISKMSGPNRAIGIALDHAANVIVENNVINLPDFFFYDSMTIIFSATVISRNNRKPDGTLIRPYDWFNSRYANDIDHSIKGVLLLSTVGI